MPKPRWRDLPPLDAPHFAGHMQIASDLGFHSISYDDLAGWRTGERTLAARPIMFDFDHPNKSIYHEIWPIMQRYGFKGTLFINTAAMQRPNHGRFMTWAEITELIASGWHIGAHMHHHTSLAYLARKDPTGGLIRDEMATCDGILRDRLGVVAKDFAYTTTTWSAAAEAEVTKRYRFGRLWTIGAYCDTDEGRVRYADLAGVAGDDEGDGGPPWAARYITVDAHPYRLPAMDLEYLIYDHAAFRRYLEGAIVEST